ncbi:MAG: hypothetical protein JNL32_09040 [Candidatus Kapabacteria bacterium]|nr:hypothetical protein [Candidatus Kapabacteria bacterium]
MKQTYNELHKELQRVRAELAECKEELAGMTALVSERTEELNTVTEHILRKRDVMLDSADELDAMKYDSVRHYEKHIKEVANTLRSQVRGTDELTDYERQVLESRDAKVKALHRTFPDLTSTELIICIHVMQQKGNKQIANLLRISVRTVEWHRSSIRKKAGIASDVSLPSALRRHLDE